VGYNTKISEIGKGGLPDALKNLSRLPYILGIASDCLAVGARRRPEAAGTQPSAAAAQAAALPVPASGAVALTRASPPPTPQLFLLPRIRQGTVDLEASQQLQY
jgi:hypothetical protein